VKRLIEGFSTPRQVELPNDDDAMKPWRAKAPPGRLLALFWAAAAAVATLGWLYLLYRIAWSLGQVIQ